MLLSLEHQYDQGSYIKTPQVSFCILYNHFYSLVSSCKERWRNIRTSYARSINVNKVPASANRTKPYYLHEELQFLALHITPGIPVSRRSASNNYTNSNSFYTSPRSEKTEMTKASMCDESIDSYAAVMHEDMEDKTQFNHEERSSSSVISEATSKNTQELETQELQPPTDVAQQHFQPQQQGQHQQQQPAVRQPSPALIAVADEERDEPEFHPPVVQIEEDNVELQIVSNTRRDSINYACAPPKKRLRVKDNCYASDNFIDAKVSQHI